LTTEVVVMNQLAVALAADSAVTITSENGNKIYNSANKLFSLSSFCPIGVMIYGSADLMEMPWETLIKLYREYLGKTKFSKVSEYARHFLDFLKDNCKDFFPEEHQARYFARSVVARYLLLEIKSEIQRQISEAKLVSNNKGFIQQRQNIVASVVNEHHQLLKDQPTVSSLPEENLTVIMLKHEAIIEDWIKNIFEDLEVSDEILQKLRAICAFLAIKDLSFSFEIPLSGIVFAGFGEKEYFPAINAFKVDFIIDNHVRFVEEVEGEISYEIPARIYPFAQSDMVEMFMEGAHPDYHTAIKRYVSEFFADYSESILKSIPQLKDEEKASLLNELKKVNKRMLSDFEQNIAQFRQIRYVQPIISNVAFLPKDELAAVAEALVNITTFQRRVSPFAETVGGPVDVAVISKKDGFIWIKRKHYFDPTLNRDYFATKYGSTGGSDVK